MTLDQIKRMADQFFEWDSEKREVVTYTSALLFAQHCVNNADYLSQLHVICADLGVDQGSVTDRLFSAIEKVRDLKIIESAALQIDAIEIDDFYQIPAIAWNDLQESLYGVNE